MTTVRKIWRQWPSWAGYAAAAWAAGYGLLAVSWALGAPGFPFGDGDVADARNDSWLWNTTATGMAPWIVVVCVLGTALALVAARGRAGGAARWGVIGAGALTAVGLLVVMPGSRLLTLLGYSPALLIGGPDDPANLVRYARLVREHDEELVRPGAHDARRDAERRDT